MHWNWMDLIEDDDDDADDGDGEKTRYTSRQLFYYGAHGAVAFIQYIHS